ncbi:hypothetical protein WMY93_016967 [Mugilogobius chulae]|uniref:Echinoderm microtubule-associated protein-like 1 n=1 Tax=Mugilogobius chulae TaxID=88201 RepID=A0AAW0NX14_9GOBI
MKRELSRCASSTEGLQSSQGPDCRVDRPRAALASSSGITTLRTGRGTEAFLRSKQRLKSSLFRKSLRGEELELDLSGASWDMTDSEGQNVDDSASACSSMEVTDRIASLEQRVQMQEDEIQLLKSALADVVRRLNMSDEQQTLGSRRGPTKEAAGMRKSPSADSSVGRKGRTTARSELPPSLCGSC